MLYCIVFVSFGQSYYFEEHGEIPSFHFLRYSLQLAPYLALLATFGVERLARLASNYLRSQRIRALLGVGVVGLLAASHQLGVALLHDMTDEEQEIRIEPTTAVCRLTPSDSFIVTAEPILPFLLCGFDRRVLALDALGARMNAGTLAARLAARRGFFYQAHGSDADRVRYASQFGVLKLFGVQAGEKHHEPKLPRIVELRTPDALLQL